MTTDNGRTRKDYAAQGRIFLEQAFQELSHDDLRQASEKGWGAASQMVKAYAQDRGLPHDQHFLLYRAISRLVAETDDDLLFDWFGAANHLHSNFYEGEYSSREVRRALNQVSQFVLKTETILNGRNGTAS